MKGIKWQLERQRLLEQAKEEAKSELRAELQKETDEKTSSKKEETTIKQQLLILHYMGILKNIDLPNTKKAKLLSTLLNKTEQDIREVLTYIEGKKEESKKIKSKDNLEFVKKHFEKLGMNEAIEKINKDLENFKFL